MMHDYYVGGHGQHTLIKLRRWDSAASMNLASFQSHLICITGQATYIVSLAFSMHGCIRVCVCVWRGLGLIIATQSMGIPWFYPLYNMSGPQVEHTPLTVWIDEVIYWLYIDTDLEQNPHHSNQRELHNSIQQHHQQCIGSGKMWSNTHINRSPMHADHAHSIVQTRTTSIQEVTDA